MYTQCPECNSIFEISAADLAVAGGFVRCGQCTASFDALNSLSDNKDSVDARTAVPDDAVKDASAASVRATTDAARDIIEPDRPAAADTQSIDVAGNQVDARTETDVAGSAETDAAQPDTAEPDTAQPDTAQPDTAETDTAQPDTAQPDTAQPDTAQPDTAQPDTAQPDTAETDAANTDTAETDAAKTDTAETDTAETDTAETDTAETDTAEIDAAETDAAETDFAETLTSGEVADEDEILLDDDYEPPFSDQEFFDDEEAIDAADDDDDLPVATPGETGDQARAESDDESAESVDDPEHGPEDQKPKQDNVDQSALFSLPLPELTALEHTEHGVLPEKLEGGEAARDPSAQAQSRQQPESMPVAAKTPATAVISPWLRTNDAFDAEDAHDLREYLNDPVNPATRAAWIGGSVLMALLLVGQVVHRYRGDLVIHPRFGPIVQSLYKTVGVDLRPNWQVNEYEVVGQARLFLMPLDNDGQNTGNENARETAEGEVEDSTAIRFVTIISNDAKLPQPAPIVRLTLRNRWGDATGSRDFTPSEYLADRTMIGQLLEPGQRLRVVLNLYDFGSDAVGFDFKMCLPDDTGTLRCADEG